MYRWYEGAVSIHPECTLHSLVESSRIYSCPEDGYSLWNTASLCKNIDIYIDIYSYTSPFKCFYMGLKFKSSYLMSFNFECLILQSNLNLCFNILETNLFDNCIPDRQGGGIGLFINTSASVKTIHPYPFFLVVYSKYSDSWFRMTYNYLYLSALEACSLRFIEEFMPLVSLYSHPVSRITWFVVISISMSILIALKN